MGENSIFSLFLANKEEEQGALTRDDQSMTDHDDEEGTRQLFKARFISERKALVYHCSS